MTDAPPPGRRVVVVTGASRGIGAAVARLFASAGDVVWGLARDGAALDVMASRATGEIRTRVCDVTDEGAVGEAFSVVGPVDVLVNNAGRADSAPLERTTLDTWQAQLAVNATGAFLCTRAVLPGMRARGWGRIVIVASVAGLAGSRYTSAYTASKHAAVGLVRAAAAEVAGTGVTANAVCPAFVDTPLTDEAVERIVARTGRSPEVARDALAHQSPLGRLVTPDEVAGAVGYLASPEAAPVNGQVIVLDGGGVQR